MKISREIIFNFFFWLLYFLYQWLGLASLYSDYDKYFINACMALPVSLLFSIITVHVFFRRLYFSKGKAMVWIGVVITSLILLFIRRYINYEFIYPKYFPQLVWMPFFSFGKILVEMVNLYAITALYAMYYFINSLYKERGRTHELLQQKTRAELDSLKAQVQPHFVFNMLNNIYSASLKSSPEAAALIAHLSGFLSYNLYESSQDKIALNTEIIYLQHYIELQKNRYGSHLDVSLNVYDDFNNFQIAPLLLLPLLENSFKHGVSSSIHQSWVRIDFSKQHNMLSVKIENSKEEPTNTTENKTGGIGLLNVRKRLALIYPNAHEMVIIDKPDTYLVVVKIKNSNHD